MPRTYASARMQDFGVDYPLDGVCPQLADAMQIIERSTSMWRNKAVLAAAITVMALGAPALARASATERAIEKCPGGHMCFYSEPGFHGELSHLEPINAHFCGPVPGVPARSVVNNSDTKWTVFTGRHCRGKAIDVEPGGFVVNVPDGVRSWY
jgi:hypothetical protein